MAAAKWVGRFRVLEAGGRRARLAALLAVSLVPGLLGPGSTGVARAHDEGPPSFECVNGPFGVPGVAGPPSDYGQWGAVMDWPDRATHSILMHTGKVLWFWGLTHATWVWDPVTETNSPPQTPNLNLQCAGHVVLADGRILTIGGDGVTNLEPPATRLFDPRTHTWSDGSDMAYGRWYPTATLLPDGRVIAVSGRQQHSPQMTATTPEIYDPQTDTWTELTAADKSLKYYPFQYLLPDGTLYVAGPDDRTWSWDFDSELWTEGATSVTEGIGGSVVMYRPWKIFKSGGDDPGEYADDRVEVIDLSDPTPAWREVAAMSIPRRRANLVLLPDGTVFMAGGSVDGQNSPECAVHEAAIWDPDTESWATMASHSEPHIYHSSAVLLPDGRVLLAGGENSHVVGGDATAEVFSPPYLFNGSRPTLASAPVSVEWGATFQVVTPDAASIDSVVFLRPGAATHNFDMDARYLALNFTDQGTHLDVTSPLDGRLAPPGYYLLFLINTAGVPSVAEFVRLGDPLPTSLPPAVPATSPTGSVLLAILILSVAVPLLLARRHHQT